MRRNVSRTNGNRRLELVPVLDTYVNVGLSELRAHRVLVFYVCLVCVYMYVCMCACVFVVVFESLMIVLI